MPQLSRTRMRPRIFTRERCNYCRQCLGPARQWARRTHSSTGRPLGTAGAINNGAGEQTGRAHAHQLVRPCVSRAIQNKFPPWQRRERVENPRIPCRSIGCNLHAALFGLYPAQWSSIETTLGVPNFVATFGYSRLMTEVSRPRRPLTLRTPRMPSANFPRARTSISRHLVNGRIRN
jgi:hypothetical protein